MAYFSKLVSPSLCEFPVHFPRYYGGVILVGVGSYALHFFLASRVIRARKDFNLPYPAMYHPSSDEFNCIQRAHQNYLETLPIFLPSLFIGGLFCPGSAIFLGSLFLVGRIVYYKGYTSGVPSNRKKGLFGFFGLMGLVLLNAFFGTTHLIASFRSPRFCPMLSS